MGCASSVARHTVEEPLEVPVEPHAQALQASAESRAQDVEAPLENAHAVDAVDDTSLGRSSSELRAQTVAVPVENAHAADAVEEAGMGRSPSELSGTETPVLDGPASPGLPKVDEEETGHVEFTGSKVDMNSIYGQIGSGKTRSITLARCEIGDAQVEELARKLSSEEGRGVAVLGLDGNPEIGDAGAAALAKALATNDTLTELSLWGSSVSDKGATALADGLRTNSTLKQLWLGECEGVTDVGANALKAALSVNTTLQQLGLICTQVTEELQDEIEGLAQAQRAPRSARGASSDRAKELVALARAR